MAHEEKIMLGFLLVVGLLGYGVYSWITGTPVAVRGEEEVKLINHTEFVRICDSEGGKYHPSMMVEFTRDSKLAEGVQVTETDNLTDVCEYPDHYYVARVPAGQGFIPPEMIVREYYCRSGGVGENGTGGGGYKTLYGGMSKVNDWLKYNPPGWECWDVETNEGVGKS